MTVSATFAFELTCEGIIRRAYQLAGLMHASHSPSGDDTTLARDLLNMELQGMQMEGLIQQHVERTTQALTDGTREYTLAADTVDVAIGDGNVAGMYVPASGGESRVTVITREEYLAKSDKTSEAIPTQVFIERGTSVKLVFWPIPPDSTASFRYSRVKLPRDTNPTTTTPDVARRRAGALLYSLAFALGLAKTIPLPRLGVLEAERNRWRGIAKADDVQRGHAQFYLES